MGEIDGVIADRRAAWSASPSSEQKTELAELVMLRGLRDLDLGHLDTAAADLREAATLLEQVGVGTDGQDRARERVITVGLARAEVRMGRVPEANDALTRVLALPGPHPGSETRAAVRLLLDVNDLSRRLGAQGRHEDVLRLALQGYGLAVSVAGRHRRNDDDLVASTLGFLAGCYANVGDLETAVVTADAAIARLRPLPGQRASLVTCQQMRHRWLRELGRPEEPEDVLRGLPDDPPS